MWLSYLKIDTPAGLLTHDLAASANPFQSPLKVDAGITSDTEIVQTLNPVTHPNYWWFATVIGIGVWAAVFMVRHGRLYRPRYFS